jgi:HEAT repeat protein
MLAFCYKCWNEITSSPTICRKCGCSIDISSHDYEKQLLDLMPNSSAAKRAEICLVLGQREKRSANPQLISIALNDEDAIVRVAALRALGAIGDPSGIEEIAKVALDLKSPDHGVAKQILHNLKPQASTH